MSLLTSDGVSLVSKEAIKIQRIEINNLKGSYQGSDIILCAQTIRNGGPITAQNRVLIIGNYVEEKGGSLTGRQVDIFPSIEVMLEKLKQYADGSIEGKTVEDAKEILKFALLLEHQTQIMYSLANRAYELNPDSQEYKILFAAALYALGVLYANDEELEDGLDNGYRLLKQSYELNPGNEKVRTNLATASLALGAKYASNRVQGKGMEDGYRLVKQAYELDPDSSEIKEIFTAISFNLANGYTNEEIEGKGLSDALPLIKQAYELNPEDDDIKDTFADISYGLGVQYANGEHENKGLSDALPLIKQALDLKPENEQYKRNFEYVEAQLRKIRGIANIFNAFAQ